jgi:thiosulfate/3-mercaptopyruvate sulfurtransferase
MTELQLPDSLVSAEWLQRNIDHPQMVIFDASWHMPASGRDGFKEWQNVRIKNARYFDFDKSVCDPDSDLPHMMPAAELFTTEVQKLGLNKNSVVVIYDSLGLFSSPRVWWMLRSMGFEQCAVLDGGLPAWLNAGFAIDHYAESNSGNPGDFVASKVAGDFCDAQAVLAGIDDPGVTILDARPGERFRGEVEEPRAGLRKGHMPGARNVSFPELLDQGRMKSKAELKQIFKRHIPTGNHTICSCGSGITACVIAFAAHLSGYDDLSVYDGSWCEWGQPGELPIE